MNDDDDDDDDDDDNIHSNTIHPPIKRHRSTMQIITDQERWDPFDQIRDSIHKFIP